LDAGARRLLALACALIGGSAFAADMHVMRV
jgi:hypothetical protein